MSVYKFDRIVVTLFIQCFKMTKREYEFDDVLIPTDELKVIS